jgi:hypothetical protein
MSGKRWTSTRLLRYRSFRSSKQAELFIDSQVGQGRTLPWRILGMAFGLGVLAMGVFGYFEIKDPLDKKRWPKVGQRCSSLKGSRKRQRN